MDTLIIDKANYDCCSISVEAHLENSLGYPIDLPPSIREKLDNNWAIECESDLLALFSLMRGYEYEEACRENTCNHESDLDTFFVYSVYAPVGTSDWCWSDNCFVVVEIGAGGDPRYSSYVGARVYNLEGVHLAETGFFSWAHGWYARYLGGAIGFDPDPLLESINEKLSPGYSGCPTYELREMCYSDPVWVEKHRGFVAKVKGASYPMVFTPVEPYYG